VAIGLNDVSNNKSTSRGLKSFNFSNEQEQKFDKEKVLRPWENYDTTETKTRTLRAQEAVRKAQAIVKRNELFTLEIPEIVKSKTFDEIYENQNKDSEHYKVPIEKYQKPTNSSVGLFLRKVWQTIANKKNA